MNTRSTGRASDQFQLRLPDGMREQIADAAKDSGRSMNSEIVHRLAMSFREVPLYATAAFANGVTKEGAEETLRLVAKSMAAMTEMVTRVAQGDAVAVREEPSAALSRPTSLVDMMRDRERQKRKTVKVDPSK